MASDSKNVSHLITQRDEFIKQYIEYDGSGRPLFIYTAPTDAVHGKPCSAVIYEYVDATSSRVVRMKELEANWNSAWEVTTLLP